jgi:hypothetical protein
MLVVAACTPCQAENLTRGFEDVEHLLVPRYCVVRGYGPYFTLDYLHGVYYGVV